MTMPPGDETINPKPTLREQLRERNFWLGCGGLLVILLVCGRCTADWMGNRPQPTPTPTVTATPVPSETPTRGPTDTPEPTPLPSPVPDLEGARDAVEELLTELNTAGGINLFGEFLISGGGRRLTVTVADAWYLAETYQKERLVESVADRYALIAAGHGLRGADPDEANYPTTSFVSVSGKEVAYKSTWRTKVNE